MSFSFNAPISDPVFNGNRPLLLCAYYGVIRNSSLLFLLVILILHATTAFSCDRSEFDWSRITNSSKHKIQGPFTIEELEKKHREEIKETKAVLPFGYLNEEWTKLKSQYKSGDKFYFVRFEEKQFLVKYYVLVRDNCIIGGLSGVNN